MHSLSTFTLSQLWGFVVFSKSFKAMKVPLGCIHTTVCLPLVIASVIIMFIIYSMGEKVLSLLEKKIFMVRRDKDYKHTCSLEFISIYWDFPSCSLTERHYALIRGDQSKL